MGFKIPRIKWEQAASRVMIKKMTPNAKMFSNKPITDIKKYIKTQGEGLYIAGLDTHVGFIYFYNQEMYFIHSNYYQREIGVMKEKLSGKNPLNDSKYRIIGKIFTDEMVEKWILGQSFS